ncbi:hypothetical protein DM02DRAFT_703859, partial [Periconia macrospinosa]
MRLQHSATRRTYKASHLGQAVDDVRYQDLPRRAGHYCGNACELLVCLRRLYERAIYPKMFFGKLGITRQHRQFLLYPPASVSRSRGVRGVAARSVGWSLRIIDRSVVDVCFAEQYMGGCVRLNRLVLLWNKDISQALLLSGVRLPSPQGH